MAAALALLAAPGGAAEAEEGEIAGNPQDGEILYGVNCAGCHGGQGLGGANPDGRPAPALVDSPQVTLDYIDLVMHTGRMPPRRDAFDNRDREVLLTDQQQADILAYMEDAFGLEREVGELAEGNAGDGLTLYAANCAACHGATGAGGVAGAGAWTPQVNAYGEETLAQAIRAGPFNMPAFDQGQLTDSDIADIAAFMRAVDDEQLAPLSSGELNPVFASGFAVILALGALVVTFLVAGKPVRYPDAQPEAELVHESGAPPDIDAIVPAGHLPDGGGADQPAGDGPVGGDVLVDEEDR